MATFNMKERVRMLHKHVSSPLPSKPRILTKLPYVVPAAVGSAPFLFKFLDPFNYNASLFFEKEK